MSSLKSSRTQTPTTEISPIKIAEDPCLHLLCSWQLLGQAGAVYAVHFFHFLAAKPAQVRNTTACISGHAAGREQQYQDPHQDRLKTRPSDPQSATSEALSSIRYGSQWRAMARCDALIVV